MQSNLTNAFWSEVSSLCGPRSHYPLTFRPEWICDVKAHLQLDNIPSKESYEYARF